MRALLLFLVTVRGRVKERWRQQKRTEDLQEFPSLEVPYQEEKESSFSLFTLTKSSLSTRIS